MGGHIPSMTSQPQHRLVPIEQLTLDIQNPRIQRFLTMYGDDISAEKIHLALGGGGDSSQGARFTFQVHH